MLSIELCAEISVPLLTKGDIGDGSGYIIAPDLVLTAYHVLFGDDVNEAKSQEITIVWREAPKIGDKPPSIKVKRKGIIWFDEELDLALIQCKLPQLGVEISQAQAIVARSMPTNEEAEWKSRGFLSSLEDTAGNRDIQKPSGKIGSINPREPIASIDVTKASLENEEFWAGFSGSPVFVNHKLSAVVLYANPGRRGASLRVVFICKALDVVAGPKQKSFAEFIGLDLTENYVDTLRGWFKPLILRKLEQSTSVKGKALDAFNTLNPGAKVHNTDDLSNTLLESTPCQCVAFIEELDRNLGEYRNSIENATLHDMAILVMCLIFPDHKAVTTITASRSKGESIIAGVTTDRIDTEAAMAAADQKAPNIKYRRGQPSYPYNVSSNERRCGLGEHHEQAVKDIAEHLIQKGVPGDSREVINNLWAELYKEGGAGDLVAKLENSDDKLRALTRRIGKKSRRFYACLSAETTDNEVAEWKKLKRWFENLDLVKLSHSSNSETVDCISDLEEVILKTQSDKYDDNNDRTNR